MRNTILGHILIALAVVVSLGTVACLYCNPGPPTCYALKNKQRSYWVVDTGKPCIP